MFAFMFASVLVLVFVFVFVGARACVHECVCVRVCVCVMSTLREVDFKLQQRKRVQTQHVRYTPTFVPPNARTHTRTPDPNGPDA